MNPLPEYPQFKEISLEDAALFNEYFKNDPPQISEFTFTNLFMWRNYYRFKWTVWNGVLCIYAHCPQHQPFFLPPVGQNNIKDCIITCILYLKNLGFDGRVQRVPEKLIEAYVADARELEAVLDHSNCDYVYRSEDLIKLSGNKYHRKKNQVNQFKKKYSFEYYPLSMELVAECLKLETYWCDLKHCDIIPSLSGEEQAIHEALYNMESLRFAGGTIFIEGRLEAFTLGESLNQDTAVIHIEKANPAIEGLYQALNQIFCAQEFPEFTYINREQDLGEEGLRQAKLSYLPHHMVNKYTVRIKD